MRFVSSTVRRSVRKISIFLLVMLLFTLYLDIKTASDHLVNEGSIDDLEWRPLHRRIFAAWTSYAGFRPSPAFANYVPRRWYLKSNVTAILDTRILGDKFISGLWPEENPQSDRIEAQLIYRPVKQKSSLQNDLIINGTFSDEADRCIYVPGGLHGWNIGAGADIFQSSSCPVRACRLTTDSQDALTADAILFRNRLSTSFKRVDHPPSQLWILYLLESPHHSPGFSGAADGVNWTATYRFDSDLVTPYEKFVLHNPRIRQLEAVNINVSATKSGKGTVAMFVSNCVTKNNRLGYAKELGKYISLDIFGACGSKQCDRRNDHQDECRDMLKRDYKFYLAFENSNCRAYITEKFWINALQSHVIPIVMGALPEDYEAVAPLKSFIHVDDYSGPEELAAYLTMLDANSTAYNEYFRWHGTGEFINTFFFCRLCSMLHSNRPAVHYNDIDRWWRGPGICRIPEKYGDLNAVTFSN